MKYITSSTHEDTGCEVSPTCLACPLPVCKYDNPNQHAYRTSKKRIKDRQMVDALDRGVHADDVAVQFSVTVRTVFRAQSRVRAGK